MHPELTVFFASMIPFVDMKLGIPLGMNLGLSATMSAIFGIAGSLIPAIITLKLLGPLSKFLRKHSKLLDNFFEKLFSKTQKEHSSKFKKYGALFLILLIVAPLPGSGPGTAALIAFVFGIDFWQGVGLIALGTIGSGLLIAGGISSVIGLIHWIY